MIALGTCAFGRALDAFGKPLDGKPAPRGRRRPECVAPPEPQRRRIIVEPFWCGVRAIDGLLTFGRGARIGLFGAPGAGKSTLVEAIVRGARADAVVVALCGERGREARDWIAACDRRTTIFCATGDRPPDERVRCAHVAFAHADALRERGLNVLLVLDSLARLAAALRELGVAAGESVGRGGYPASVFAQLARILEIAGSTGCGAITLVATVLDDGGERDPVSDAARSLLDGHVALSPRLAAAGRFPAIDVLGSASRTASAVTGPVQGLAAAAVRGALAVLERIDDARSLGIVPPGDEAARAIAAEDRLERFLRQGARPEPPERTLAALTELADILEGSHGYI